MTVWVAFLSAVNVGKRKMRMADLKSVCEAQGFAAVRTVLASGNVCLQAATDPKARLEAAIERHWGWRSEAILRTADEIAAMLASDPFRDWPESEAYHRYVMLLDAPLPAHTALTRIPGDFEVARVDAREIYLVGHRQPDGRHGPGLDKFDRQFEKGTIATTRNWNTLPKVLT